MNKLILGQILCRHLYHYFFVSVFIHVFDIYWEDARKYLLPTTILVKIILENSHDRDFRLKTSRCRSVLTYFKKYQFPAIENHPVIYSSDQHKKVIKAEIKIYARSGNLQIFKFSFNRESRTINVAIVTQNKQCTYETYNSAKFINNIHKFICSAYEI